MFFGEKKTGNGVVDGDNVDNGSGDNVDSDSGDNVDSDSDTIHFLRAKPVCRRLLKQMDIQKLLEKQFL
jgi:hypothetical protein